MALDSFSVSTDRQIEELLRERARLAGLNEDINIALIREGALPGILTRCTEVLIRHLGVAAARIWTFNTDENVLKLQAGSGINLPLDEQYFRIKIGESKIGVIAKERLPLITNDALNDSLFTAKKWIKREKMMAFAGYPLIVEERLVGVICVFAREPLTELTLQAIASVSNAIANGIERKQMKEGRRDLIKRLEEAREGERRRLSRQLHDDVVQQLAAASIKLQQLEKKLVELLPEENSVIADIVIAQELLYRNQQSLRQVAHILHPNVLEHFGLAEALRKFTAGVKVLSTGDEPPIAVCLKLSPDFPRLESTIESSIYRIVQEAVINIIKHARAESVSLEIGVGRNSVFVIIQDDGCGFNSKKNEKSGIGLASMRERAEIIGAKMSIKSQNGKGTKITLKINFEEIQRSSQNREFFAKNKRLSLVSCERSSLNQLKRRLLKF